MVKRDDPLESAPTGEYEPDEDYVRSLFARPARQPERKAEVFVAGAERRSGAARPGCLYFVMAEA